LSDCKLSPLFLDTVFPVRCLACDRPGNVGILELCLSCICTLCPVAEGHLGDYVSRSLSANNNSGPIRGYAGWYYDEENPARLLQKRIKYDGHRTLGKHLGMLLGRRINEQAESSFDVITPIPLHRIRLIERGHNQSTDIANGLCSETGIPVDESVIRRTSFTASQVGRSRDARRLNLEGVFSTGAGTDVRGLHILLIDDVVTTGATLFSAIQTLSSAGAGGISVAALFFVRPDISDSSREEHYK